LPPGFISSRSLVEFVGVDPGVEGVEGVGGVEHRDLGVLDGQSSEVDGIDRELLGAVCISSGAAS